MATRFIELPAAEFDAVLAALRHLAVSLAADESDAGRVRPNDGDIGDILTCSGEHAGLTAEQIHDLADSMNESAWAKRES
jgi:hypothetical protein